MASRPETMAATSERISELCPRCGRRVQEDDRTGFCIPCAGQSVVEQYQLQEVKEIAARRQSWAKQKGRACNSRPAARERQRRHRLLEQVRPTEPAPPGTDPLELGREGVLCLNDVIGHFSKEGLPAQLVALHRAREIIRQLAWGPDPNPPWAGPRRPARPPTSAS
jgi:hypothetical protein